MNKYGEAIYGCLTRHCVGTAIAQPQVAGTIRREVVQQMISDGSISRDCVREQGVENINSRLEIYPIKLTRNG